MILIRARLLQGGLFCSIRKMIKDYRPNQPNKKPKAKAGQAKTKAWKINPKLFFSGLLLLLIIFFVALAVKIELAKFYRLKSSERILLLNETKPLAILFFNVENKQLVLTDLSGVDFDLSILEKEATLAAELKKNLLYSFLLDVAFEQSFVYPSTDLSREELLSFFKDKPRYYFFLKDSDLLWREQKFEKKLPSLSKPTFDCPVALINTTSEAGLASSLASILEKSAFSIIKKDNNKQDLEQTKIFYDPDEKNCAPLLEKMQKILPTDLVVADREEVLSHRASLVIYIGRDLADLYVFFVNFFHGQI